VENAALKHDLADERAHSSEARAQFSLLEGEIATIHRTHVGARVVMCARGGGGGGGRGGKETGDVKRCNNHFVDQNLRGNLDFLI